MWVAIGSLSSFALSIVSAAILSRYLDKNEYGTYRQILYVYNSLLIIFSAGLPRVFAYFLPRYSLEEGKNIVSKITLLLLISGIVFSLFLFLFSDIIAELLKNQELSRGLKYFSPIPFLLLPTLGLEGILASYKKSYFIATYNIVSRFITLFFIVFAVVYLKTSYISAIAGWIVGSIFSFGFAIYFKNKPFNNIKPIETKLSLKEIFSYSLPLVSASIAGIMLRSADQFYISRYFGTEIFAEYSNGFIQIPFVAMITGATALTLMPQFSKMIYENVAATQIAELWRGALIKSALLIYPIVTFFIFNSKVIIRIVYSEAYDRSSIYFQIAMVANLFNIVIFAPLLLSLGESKFYSKVHFLFALFAWGSGYLIVKIFHKPEIIAIFSVLITILLVIVNIKYISKLLNLKFLELIPATKILMILVQSVLVMLFIELLNSIYFNILPKVQLLSVDFIFYIIIILLTAKFFKINYLQVIRPLFLKV